MARLSIIDYTLYRQGPDELPLDLYYAAQQTTLSHSAVENKRTNQPLEIVSWCKKPKVNSHLYRFYFHATYCIYWLHMERHKVRFSRG